ncbi:MAG TPA: hypothetical protein VNO31_29650 [Umezawaea sp.]|nr:hypothetical protein [Umezawaea sp.]
MAVPHARMPDRHPSPVRALRWLPSGSKRGGDRLAGVRRRAADPRHPSAVSRLVLGAWV